MGFASISQSSLEDLNSMSVAYLGGRYFSMKSSMGLEFATSMGSL